MHLIQDHITDLEGAKGPKQPTITWRIRGTISGKNRLPLISHCYPEREAAGQKTRNVPITSYFVQAWGAATLCHFGSALNLLSSPETTSHDAVVPAAEGDT